MYLHIFLKTVRRVLLSRQHPTMKMVIIYDMPIPQQVMINSFCLLPYSAIVWLQCL